MTNMIGTEITKYIEREIITRYAAFDKAHREDHVRAVIKRSLKLAGKMPGIDPAMVYVVAAFHDLGLVNGRENHHHDSKKILENDRFLSLHFTPEQIRIMGEAVEDHRASNNQRPRSDYGLIVAEADRLIVPETIIRRAIQYGLSHYPDLDYNGHYERTLQHLTRKYGRNGYLRIWIPWSDNAQRLKEFHTLMEDKDAIQTLFHKLFEEETYNGSPC
ncbi:MAG: HD domain-containing protein [Clostridium sp.]|nr:HD domain-containing protein [Clostridium sp.]